MSWVLRSNVARPELLALHLVELADELRLFNLDDKLLFNLDDELLFNDEFDNITLNLDDKLLNAAYDIRYNYLG